MRKVLHVGPCDAPGGMATVIGILAAHPPEGWQAATLSPHASGSVLAKWRAYRRARGVLRQRCTNEQDRPDVVHLHAAADWSWRRKKRLASLVRAHDIPVVMHLHSGKFDRWLLSQSPKKRSQIRDFLQQDGVQCVVLSEGWRVALQPLIGGTTVVPNPVLPAPPSSNRRDHEHLLVLGRPDPVKGHAFAERLVSELRKQRPSLTLTLTGNDRTDTEGVHALGWVSEEKKQQLLHTASLMLVPSGYEGQPMVMLEALACGLPVCVSDRLLDVPNTVGVAAYGDLEDWGKKVDALLDQPPTAEAIEAAAAPHHVEVVTALWKAHYEALIKP